MSVKVLLVLLSLYFMASVAAKDKKPIPYIQKDPSAKYNNPGEFRDRAKKSVFRPVQDLVWNNRFKKRYHPAWMDYCDPKHCDDYHKPACGLNRVNMKFKWFQSGCHIVLNNYCAGYRGNLKYDTINTTFCTIYVMYVRNSCPTMCDEDVDPVCGVSSVDNHVVMFRNRCYFELDNCRKESMNEYEDVDTSICKYTYLFSKDNAFNLKIWKRGF